MRRLLLAAALTASLVFAAQASADTTLAVKMTFTEPIATPFIADCPVAPEGFCGTGQVIPLGQATETIDFGAGCGGSCDVRTITLAEGSIIALETFSNGACPGQCVPNPADPASGTLTDTIIGGTGVFAGATGTLSGTVRATAGQSVIKLTGTITFDP